MWCLPCHSNADVLLLSWDLGGSAALDFAVSSGLRTDILQDSTSSGAACILAYEDRKRNYLQTADALRDQGTQFIPMIVEAHSGSWGPSAQKFWRKLDFKFFTLPPWRVSKQF